jgi:hypothetical protein
MPPIEWIEPYKAALQLRHEWNIPYEAAQDIVQGVLLGAKCSVRGRRAGHGLRDISKDIAAALSKDYITPGCSNLIPWGFSDVEIDWNGLLKHGRELVPREWEYLVSAAEASSTGDATKAATYLAEKLAIDPNMKFDDAWQDCKKAFPALSGREFRPYVWEQARKAAGLERHAPPGRKSKIRHS